MANPSAISPKPGAQALGVDALAFRRLEQHAHEEGVGRGVAVLAGFQDRLALGGQEAGDGRDNPLPLGTTQDDDELGRGFTHGAGCIAAGAPEGKLWGKRKRYLKRPR
jgi:hypothetical protein